MTELQGGESLSRVLLRLRDTDNKSSEGGTIESWFHHLSDGYEFPGAACGQRFTASNGLLSFEVEEDSGELCNRKVYISTLKALESIRIDPRFDDSLRSCHIHALKAVDLEHIPDFFVHLELYHEMAPTWGLVHASRSGDPLFVDDGAEFEQLFLGLNDELMDSI